MLGGGPGGRCDASLAAITWISGLAPALECGLAPALPALVQLAAGGYKRSESPPARSCRHPGPSWVLAAGPLSPTAALGLRDVGKQLLLTQPEVAFYPELESAGSHHTALVPTSDSCSPGATDSQPPRGRAAASREPSDCRTPDNLERVPTGASSHAPGRSPDSSPRTNRPPTACRRLPAPRAGLAPAWRRHTRDVRLRPRRANARGRQPRPTPTASTPGRELRTARVRYRCGRRARRESGSR